MASTRDIRRRIRSVKNTAQITKAMQMVAASKMRRAQQSALSGRPYSTLLNTVLSNVTASAGDFTHPFIEVRPVKNRAVILVSSDKGLAGVLNSNLLLEAKASEHSARMVAMKNATDNAKQIIKDLTLEYNKLRQANITKELLEITSATMAMGQ